jgi:DNA primase
MIDLAKIAELEDKEEFDQLVDWKKYNSKMRSVIWQYPPKIDREALEDFFDKEGVEEIAYHKLTECIDRQTQLRNELQKETDPFLQELEIAIYTEYFVIEKWITYWSRTLEILGVKPARDFELSATTVMEAKNYPLPELYRGNLTKRSGNFVGICPFHEENTPSFTIYTKDNTYYCFGCHRRGDSIDFMEALEGITFIQAVKKLTNNG